MTIQELQQLIISNIYENTSGDISGSALQNILLQISNKLSDGLYFGGVVSDESSLTPDTNSFYICLNDCTYQSFGDVVVESSPKVQYLIYDNILENWNVEEFPIPTFDFVNIAESCLWGGVVTPNEEPIHGNDHRYFYLAFQEGRYTNFNNYYVDSNVCLFYWREGLSNWAMLALWPNTESLDELFLSKADRVNSPTNGHLAGLNAQGNLTDSGIAADDVATQQDLATKQDTIQDLSTIRSGAAAGATALQPSDISSIENAISIIESVIPAQASEQNQLADKNFVNSQVTTASANFVGTFETLEELQAVQNPTKNDYGFVIETDALGNQYYDRYKYNGTAWLFEYKVESTSFTSEQWAAIQSGITSGLVQTLGDISENYLKTGESAGTGSVDFDAFADTVHNIPQTLSSSQKQQARQNIDAVSGADLKTLNGQSLVGNGNIDIQMHFKGWFNTLAELKAAHTATEGDSAYVKDVSPATTWSIYVYDSTAGSNNFWADSGTDADTSNVQTFASSQEVNEVHIVNDLTTGGVDDVLSAEQGVVLDGQVGQLEQEVYGLDYEIVTGKYVKPNGTIGNSVVGFYTVPFLLLKGETITYDISGNTCSILSSYSNETFTPIVVASGPQSYTGQTYTAAEDIYIAFSGTPGTLNVVSNISKSEKNARLLEELQQEMEEILDAGWKGIPLQVGISGKAITDEGVVVNSQYYNISNPIYIGADSKVKVTTAGFLLSALSKYDSSTDTYTPIVAYGNDSINTPRTAETTIEESGFYVVCNNGYRGTWKLEIKGGKVVREYAVDMVMGSFMAANGNLFYGVDGSVLRMFVSEKLLAVNRGDTLLEITGVESGDSYYIAQYDENYRFIGYATNTLPTLDTVCRFLRFAVTSEQQFAYSEKKLGVIISGEKSCEFAYNSAPIVAGAIRWIWTVFEVKNTTPVGYPGTPSVNFFGDTERLFSKGYIVLPDNYDPNGKSCKVVLNCHGTNQLTFNATALNYNTEYINFLAKCGYAVIGCCSQTSKYRTERDTNLPSSLTMSTYQCLWEYMTRMFNLDKTGAYVFGYSAGGAETILLSHLKTIPIKCAASLAGTMDAICNMRLMWDADEMEGIFNRFGIPYDGETIPTYLSTQGRLKVVDQSVRQYMLANFDKIKPYNAITFNSTIDTEAFEERFMSVDADTPTLEADSTLSNLVNNARIFLNTPVKIWQAVDDVNVPIQPSRWFAKMVMNGGGICFLREFPSGCGAHYAVGNTEHPDEPTPMVDYVTPYGETVNVPVAYAEMVEWFRKW